MKLEEVNSKILNGLDLSSENESSARVALIFRVSPFFLCLSIEWG